MPLTGWIVEHQAAQVIYSLLIGLGWLIGYGIAGAVPVVLVIWARGRYRKAHRRRGRVVLYKSSNLL